MSPLAHPPDGFLDAASGQPLAPATVAAFQAANEFAWADPGRLHHPGRQSGLLLETARASLASGLQIDAASLQLSASGTSALQYAVDGVLRARPTGQLVVGAVEPLATFAIADAYAKQGGRVQVLPVDHVGRVHLDDLSKLLAAGDTVAVCLQAANPEVGTRQPIAEAHAMTQHSGVPLIVDATGVLGHDQPPTSWDLLTADARDWAGPAGVGVLAVRPGMRWLAPYGAERGWLGGVANVPAAAGAATAWETLAPQCTVQASQHRSFIDQLRAGIAATISDVDIVGDPIDRLPQVLTFSVLYANGEALVTELDRRGFAVASGSACVVDSDRASHVLAAMGAFTGGNIRITLPYNCTQQTIDGFLTTLPDAVAAVREVI